MPGKGIEYALLQKSIDLTTFGKRLHRIATEKERKNDTCLLLTEICYNSKKQILKNGLERLPVATRQYYMEQIQNLDNQIQNSKKMFPNFKGKYDI